MSRSIEEVKARFKELITPYLDNLLHVDKPILDTKVATELIDLWYSLSKAHDFTEQSLVRTTLTYILLSESSFSSDIKMRTIHDERIYFPYCLIGYSNLFDKWFTLDTFFENGAVYRDSCWYDADISNFTENERLSSHSTRVEQVVTADKLFKKAKGEHTTTPRICYVKDGEFILEDTKEQFPYDDSRVVSRIPYYGIELEAIRKKNAPADLTNRIKSDMDGHVDIKRDGSVSANGHGNSGLEIVSVPATFRAHKELWQKFFSEEGSSKFLRSWNTGVCGIHVHISRLAFTPPHLARFVGFINSPKTRRLIEDVAGRSGSQWAKYIDSWTFSKVFKEFKGRSPSGSDKYKAVNLNPKDTIEVRIFRGNVRKSGFFKCLEFVDAVFNYTKSCSYREVSTEKFIEWLKTNNYGYGNLIKWLTIKEYINSNVKLERRDECA